MPTTGERKGKEKEEEEITKEIDAKQAFFPNYQSMKEMDTDH